ncbi:type II CRISPR RNA-guided endonuclease Cas9, partial [Candidatus Sumerlaeota bacterium]|nr:type II CRISPR RNA-guided endonuclease Cas9 [Candidatus Sumerlaeota bacterium]
PGYPERRLTHDELHLLLNKLHSVGELKFDKIRSLLNLAEYDVLNLEDSQEKKIAGNPVESGIRKIFKKEYKKNPEKIHWLCTEVFDALIKEDVEVFRIKAMTEWDLTEEQIDALYKIKRPQGYMSYSCKAMQKLIPLMEQGLDLYEAKEKLGYREPEPEISDFLPPVPEIPNPVVRRALTETRKIVNLIIREYGKPSRIVVELARETKGTIKQRNERLKVMRKNEEYNNYIISELKAHNIPVNKQNIRKYKLAEQCGWICPYTGKKFSIQTLFFTNDFEIEHIIPYSRSYDNSLLNLTISEARFNRERKKDKTPYETFGDTPEYEQFCVRISKMKNMPVAKKRRFLMKEVTEDFTSRQLTDTSYIAREVRKYLRSLGIRVDTTRGPITSELRHQWGLNSILWELNETLELGENKSYEEKSRADHRHHAIDAIVIGLTNPRHIKALAKKLTFRRDEVFPSPWESAGIDREMFRQIVKSVIANINVSYRPERKLSGQLHKETNYGLRADGHYTYRVPLSEITISQIEDIVDPVVKNVVVERLQKLGINPKNKKANIPRDAFKDLRMPARKGEKQGHLIKKVRIATVFSNAIPIKDKEGKVYRYVLPAENHHVAIFEYKDSKGRIKRLKEVVSLPEAMRRKLNGEPVVRRTHPERPDARFLFSLCKQDMVILKCNDGVERLYRVQKFTDRRSKEGVDIFFRLHTDARKVKEVENLPPNLRDIIMPCISSLSVNKFQATKVTVDPLGRIRNAND